MPKVLTDDQVAFYRQEGFLSPIDGPGPARAAEMLGALDRFEAEHGFAADRFKLKGHLALTEAWELAHDPAILDVVEDLIGPNILAFGSRFWIKPSGDGSFVSWHQDSAYFGCEPHEMVTCWIALTEATRENGCLRVVPRSQHEGHAHEEHGENAAGDAPDEKRNLLSRGQTIRGIDEAKSVYMDLKPGQFSVHNERTVHASHPNESGAVRIGFSFSLIPTHVKSHLPRRPATLVRGVDKYGYWDTDPVPTKERLPDIIRMMLDHNAQYTDPQYRQNA